MTNWKRCGQALRRLGETAGDLALAALALLLLLQGALPWWLGGGLTLAALAWLHFRRLAQQRRRYQHSLRTLNNMLEALLGGDYGFRARSAVDDPALQQLVAQVNALAAQLAQGRLSGKEQQLLMGKLCHHLSVAVIGVSAHGTLSLVNAAAARLLGEAPHALEGRPAGPFGLGPLLDEEGPAVREWEFPARRGRFQIWRDRFIDGGERCELLFISDVLGLLRHERQQAWQDLLRVVSHEINNSLTPIASLSQTLAAGLRDPGALPPDTVQEGLALIQERALKLREFVHRYRQLGQLPPPQAQAMPLTPALQTVASLFPRRRVALAGPDGARILADPVLFEQLLINLLKNADEAMRAAPDAAAEISWRVQGRYLQLALRDGGGGLANPANLFVPFYSTKPSGSGIGLALCRQIVESHGGYISLHNREDGPGCVVKLQWPLAPAVGDVPPPDADATASVPIPG